MKRPKKPKEPIKPIKPKKLLDEGYREAQIGELYEGITPLTAIEAIATRCGLALKDISIEVSICTDYTSYRGGYIGGDSETTRTEVHLLDTSEAGRVNKNYDKQYKKYEKDMAVYEEKQAIYAEQARIYESERYVYDTHMLKMQHDQAKKALDKLTKKLEPRKKEGRK